jgi:hypothetical protein
MNIVKYSAKSAPVKRNSWGILGDVQQRAFGCVSPLLGVRSCDLESAISNYRQASRSMGCLRFEFRPSIPPGV